MYTLWDFIKDEWKTIADESAEFGCFLIKTPTKWRPQKDYKDTFEKEEEGLLLI